MSANAIPRPAIPILQAVRLTSLALLFVCSGQAYSYSEAAGQQFRSGTGAFQAGDYPTALAAFESALAQGMSGPALHFNIGVAAYRSGNYARAEIAFKEVANTPAMAGLAYYNLGLVELRRNDPAAAKRWFSRVESATEDPKLRQLAGSQLGEVEPPAPDHAWFGYAGFGIGHDDNVALVSNSDVLGISGTADNFAEAQLSLSTPLGDSWRIDGAVTYVDYQDLNDFDQLGLQTGGRYRWHIGDWTNDAGLQVAYTMLDGSGFETRRAIYVQTSRELRSDLTMRGRYRFSDIDGLGDFGGLSGRRHELGASLTWIQAAWDFRFGYRLEIGDYDDASLSATRHELTFDAENEFATDWTILIAASGRRSAYDDDTNENEQRTELALALTRSLTARWQVFLRYSYTNNDADASEFDYTGNRISAGVEATL